MKKEDGDEDNVDQLNLDEEGAKNDLYNEKENDEDKRKNDTVYSSNRYTLVDNNFDEDKSRENSIGVNNNLKNNLVEINNNILNEDDDIHEAGSSRVSKRKKNILNAKIIIVGDASVGKTSIIGRYINNSFDDKYQCTIQAQLNPKIINLDENTDLKLNIWDTAGQERYRSMTRMFYRDSQGAIIVFDLTKKDTFNDVQNWIKELKTHGCADTEIIILGNKSDLTNERDISDEDIKTVFKDYSYFEVSAKNGYNISLAFDKLRKLVVENIKAKDNNPTVKQRKLSHEKNKKGTLEDIERNIYKGTNKKSGKNKKCC